LARIGEVTGAGPFGKQGVDIDWFVEVPGDADERAAALREEQDMAVIVIIEDVGLEEPGEVSRAGLRSQDRSTK